MQAQQQSASGEVAAATSHILTQEQLLEAFAADPTAARRAIFDFNKQTLAAAMRGLGISSLTVSYSGSGDSGQIDEVSFEPWTELGADDTAQAAVSEWHWNGDDRRSHEQLVFAALGLVDFAESLCDAAIALCDHDGYENNDGGEGRFTLQAEGASAELEHSDFYVERETSTHAL